jgi:hypothetical protein
MDYDDGITNTVSFTRSGPMHLQGLSQTGAVAAGEDAATVTATAAISNCMTSNQTPGRGMPSSTLWRAHAIRTVPIAPVCSLKRWGGCTTWEIPTSSPTPSRSVPLPMLMQTAARGVLKCKGRRMMMRTSRKWQRQLW